MNRKGQALVAFIIILPIVLLFLAVVIDVSFMLKEKTKLTSVTKTILLSTYKKKEEERYLEDIENLFLKNGIPKESLLVEIKENEVKVCNQYEINSLFGKIIGLKTYKIRTCLKAEQNREQIKISKE